MRRRCHVTVQEEAKAVKTSGFLLGKIVNKRCPFPCAQTSSHTLNYSPTTSTTIIYRFLAHTRHTASTTTPTSTSLFSTNPPLNNTQNHIITPTHTPLHLTFNRNGVHPHDNPDPRPHRHPLHLARLPPVQEHVARGRGGGACAAASGGC